MKITGPGKIETQAVGRKFVARTRNGAGFSVDQIDDTGGSSTKPVAGAGPAAAVGGLLSIQEVDDQGRGRRGALNRAEEMLDLLDDIRHGLLIGAISEHKLRRLLALSNAGSGGYVDHRLADILSGIELRAKVEIAKLEMSRVIL